MAQSPKSELKLLVACPECSRQYDATGRAPGTRFRCRCGVVLEVPAPRDHEAKVVRCSACGGPRQGAAATCQFCGADFTLHEQDLHTVCPGCYTRISDRARFCHHCGTAIVPEEDSREISELACPACGPEHRLNSRSLGQERLTVLECSRCAGMWIGSDVFALLEKRAKVESVFDLETAQPTAPLDAASNQRGPLYRPCPQCGKLMNRRNYGRRSGVVIDGCKEHGLWFDHQELDRILLWVREGGIERKREIESEEQREEERRERQRKLRDTEAPLLGSLAGPARSRHLGGIDLVVDLVDFLGRSIRR